MSSSSLLKVKSPFSIRSRIWSSSAQIASAVKKFEDYPVRFFYSICGTGDGTAFASASAAAKDLPKYSDRFTEANWLWQECPGAHSFEVWNLGLYNFLRIVGR